jgi:hypothetical protein
VCLAALGLVGGAVADTKTGQSPRCKRFCMSVEPRVAGEGSVFRITGRDWRPRRHVRVTYGAYCRPGQPCILVLHSVRRRTDRQGRFTFRIRAGQPELGDAERGITSGSGFTFSQWLGKPGGSHLVQRRPRYRVILPD